MMLNRVVTELHTSETGNCAKDRLRQFIVRTKNVLLQGENGNIIIKLLLLLWFYFWRKTNVQKKNKTHEPAGRRETIIILL